MAPAVFDTTTLDFDVAVGPQPQIGRHSYLFRATGSVVKFQGFLALYREAWLLVSPSRTLTWIPSQNR